MEGYMKNIRLVTPYTPGEQPQRKVIKLNTNECPYPPTPKAAQALESIDIDRLRLYPDPAATALVESWAKHAGLTTDEVFVGVGSDDVLSMCFLTFFAGKDPILFPDITYSFYDVWCDVYRIPFEVKPLDENFFIRKEDYIGVKNGGIVIANPNAPTGVQADMDMIEEIVKANPDSVVIIDEAYVDFGAKSAAFLIRKYDNVIVVQTFSKSRAMAGLRVGFAMGPKHLIKYLNDVKYSVNSYTMNYPSIVLGKAAIEDEEYLAEVTGKIIATRERSKVRLAELGFEFTDSDTNFIFAKHSTVSGQKIFDELKKRDIYVRHWNKERIADHLRITVGTDEEMDELFKALEEIING